MCVVLTNELKCQQEKLPPCQNKWPEEKLNITPVDDVSISEPLASSHSEQVDMPDEIEADREVNIVALHSAQCKSYNLIGQLLGS